MESIEKLSKQEIINQFEQDLNEKSVEELLISVRELKEKFDEATAQEKLEILNTEENNEAKEKTPENPLDGKFTELYNVFQERKTAHKQALTKAEEDNYQAKLEIIESLKNITEGEISNIGEAFKQVNELKEKWYAIGAVNKARYKQLQFDFSHVLDLFYYNIGIHKELKNYDLKKNAEIKEAIIEKLQHLLQVESIKQLEHFIKEYQNEWDLAGPTTQEKWEELKNKYWDAVNAVYEKIKEHYHQYRTKLRESHEKKQLLLENLLSETSKIDSFEKINDWNKATESIIKLQEEWLKIGFIKRNHEQNLSTEFRSTIDDFFKQKSAFFEKLKTKQKKSEEIKRNLIEKVNTLKSQTDWVNTSTQIIKLQADWKKTGNTHPKIDQKLWTEFRAACDTFFSTKKEYFDTLDDRLEENFNQKKNAVEKMQNADSAEALSKAVEDWYLLGFVPKNKVTESNTSFEKALKSAGEKLKIANIEDFQFEIKIKALKKAENGKEALNNERKFIEGKIDKIKSELAQYENNLAFFGPSKGAQKLKDAVEARMSVAKENLNNLEGKLKLLKSN